MVDTGKNASGEFNFWDSEVVVDGDRQQLGDNISAQASRTSFAAVLSRKMMPLQCDGTTVD
jgi:hypothetical protein